MTQPSQNPNGSRAITVDLLFRWLNGILSALLLAVIAGGLAMWADVKVIKANRFTSVDGLMTERMIREDMRTQHQILEADLSSLQAEIATLRALIETMSPP